MTVCSGRGGFSAKSLNRKTEQDKYCGISMVAVLLWLLHVSVVESLNHV